MFAGKIGQKSSAFINHKPFHPGNLRNLEKVWLAERSYEDGAKRQKELLEKRQKELKLEELERAIEIGSSVSAADGTFRLDGGSNSKETKLEWMYQDVRDDRTSNDEVERKKILLGETIVNQAQDKDLQQIKKLETGGVAGSVFLVGPCMSDDRLRALREDPLFCIKQAEQNHRRKQAEQKKACEDREEPTPIGGRLTHDRLEEPYRNNCRPKEQRYAEQRPAEQRYTEHRHAEQRHTEQRHAEQRHTEQRHAEQRYTEQRYADQRYTERRERAGESYSEEKRDFVRGNRGNGGNGSNGVKAERFDDRDGYKRDEHRYNPYDDRRDRYSDRNGRYENSHNRQSTRQQTRGRDQTAERDVVKNSRRNAVSNTDCFDRGYSSYEDSRDSGDSQGSQSQSYADVKERYRDRIPEIVGGVRTQPDQADQADPAEPADQGRPDQGRPDQAGRPEVSKTRRVILVRGPYDSYRRV